MKVVYQEQLTNYIYGEEDQNILFQGLNKYSNRQIFINEMMWLHRNLYGETAKRLHDLYFNLDLYSHSLKNLSSNRWAVKARGFRELAQMEVKDVAQEILAYVNSKNQVLRVEAQLALVKLNPDDPLGFFDNLKLPLSKWEQLNILNTLQNNEVKVESFERWMDSENDSVVVFSIKMAGLFNHIHSWTKILELVYHGNSEVRRIAVETLGLFELPENLEMFKDFYRNHLPVEENGDDIFYNLKMSNNRLAAIEALEKIATESDVPFFKFVLRNEKEFVILQKSVNVLDAISNGNLSVWDEAYDHVEPKVQMIIDQKR
ncbi:MAG TPA: HEAT repeat domain-containing protein [Bacteroidales bacterium]|nr:HEAT repeat domain-containing protein [Bacteroidales bacterium]